MENLSERKAPPPGPGDCHRAAAAKAGAVIWGSGGEEVMMPARTGRRQETAAVVKANRAATLSSFLRLEPKPSALQGPRPLPGRACPPAAAGSLAGEVAAAGSAPGGSEPPAHPPARPLGDPASSPRPLEVCKLSPGVPPHHREVGDTGGGSWLAVSAATAAAAA